MYVIYIQSNLDIKTTFWNKEKWSFVARWSLIPTRLDCETKDEPPEQLKTGK